MAKLKDIYEKHSTEKAGFGDKGSTHSYIDYYSKAFKDYRHQPITFLEIGIKKGHSIAMWREYFTNARIIGMDIIDRGANIDNVELIYSDATIKKSFDFLDNVDIVIDDGSHLLEHQLKSFEILFPKLSKNGLYIIEDIADLDKDRDKFLNLSKNVIIKDFRKIKNRYDDVIIEIRK